MDNHATITPHSKIAIAGAGIGGLTTALALHQAGFANIKIIESARELKPLGLGLNVQPESTGVLYNLGLTQQLRETGIATAEFRHMDQSGALIRSHPCGTFSGNAYPLYSIHRGEFQMLLLSAVNQRLGPQAIQLGTSLEYMEQTAGKVTLHCRNRKDHNTFSVSADLLIGADGIHSAVCATLHPHHNSPRRAPFTLWRGVTLMDHFLDGQTGVVIHDQKWSRLVAYPISKHHADSGKALVYWAFLIPDKTPRVHNTAKSGSSARPDEILPYLVHWKLDWLDVANLLSNSQLILKYPIVDREPLPFWSEGRVTLLGDAAHPMYPTGSNGASQAILDAAALSRALAVTNNLNAALAEYEHKRRDAVSRIVFANREREKAEWATATMNTHAKRAAISKLHDKYHYATATSRKVA